MKVIKLLTLSFFVLLSISGFSQERKYSTFYEQRASLFDELKVEQSDIIFLGNSITNGAEWAELFNNYSVKNRGISGDTCEGVYDRLESILRGHPRKVFLLIGINDLGRGSSSDFVVKGIKKIVCKIIEDSPNTEVYIQSLLPVNNRFNLFSGHTSKGEDILKINKALISLSDELDLTYIDLYSFFVNQEGMLDEKYTNDGLHLLGKGYKLWVDIVKRYIIR